MSATMTDRPEATSRQMDTETASVEAAAHDSTSGKRVKHFVLDTNVLLHNPNALFVFEENHVIIPYPVIEELDTMKRREDDIGRSARQCIRHLDRLRETGKLTEPVAWGDMPVTPEFNPTALAAEGKTGTIRIDVTDHARPAAISKDMPDNRIIAVAYALSLRASRRSLFPRTSRHASKPMRSESSPKTSRTRRSTPTSSSTATSI